MSLNIRTIKKVPKIINDYVGKFYNDCTIGECWSYNGNNERIYGITLSRGDEYLGNWTQMSLTGYKESIKNNIPFSIGK